MLLIKDLNKYYKTKMGERYHALNGINLSLEEKGFVFILGKSGCGKSTLLNILGGLDTYDSGEIIIQNRQTDQFKSHEWDTFRNTYVGFVFQEFYMIESFTIGKNISISLELQGYPKKQIKQRVEDILKQVGLDGYMDRKPSEISGGQKQRIAIARALIKDPQIILADEPTGNLDSETGKAILDILKQLSKEKLVIMVTHDAEYARIYGDRIIELKDGIIINDGLSQNQNLDGVYENVDEDTLSIIHLSKEKELNQELIQYLNQQTKNNKDASVILTTDLNSVTSTNIELNKTNDVNITVNHQQTNQYQQLKLKGSKLPSKYAIKLATDNILMKKFRFIFINFLFIISLILVGFATMLSFFDFPAASSETFRTNDLKYMGFKKAAEVIQVNNEVSYDRPLSISDGQFIKLKEDFPQISFARSTAKEMYFTSKNARNMHFFTNKLNYVTIIEDQEMFPLSGGRYPSEVGEVLISDYIARVMQLYVYNPIQLNEILGKKVVFGEQEYKIVGFVDTDYEKFSRLEKAKSIESFKEANFFNTAATHYKHLYMTQETYDFTFDRISIDSAAQEQLPYFFILAKAESVIIPDLIGNSRIPNLDNEIIIPASFAYEFILSKNFSEFQIDDEELLALIGGEFNLNMRPMDNSIDRDMIAIPIHVDLPTRNYTIVGIYNDINMEHMTVDIFRTVWYGTESEINNIDTLLEPYKNPHNPIYNMGYVKLSDNHIENKRFVKQIIDKDLVHVTEYSDDLYKMNDLINRFEIVFYIIGIIIASFTGLMIYLFISMSIQMKQKEIGILRALGARGIDIAKIYLFEGFIIAMISSLLANGILIGLVYLSNYYLAVELDIKLVLFTFGVFNFLFVCMFALIVIILSTILPIKRITIMKPINAIKRV